MGISSLILEFLMSPAYYKTKLQACSFQPQKFTVTKILEKSRMTLNKEIVPPSGLTMTSSHL